MKRMTALILAAVLLLSLTACGGKEEAKNVDLNAIYEGYSQYLPDMFLADESTMLNFLGIEAADCTQVVVAISGEGMRTDEVWLIQAKDEVALEKIRNLASVRQVAKEDETISYAPDQYAVVVESQTVTNGLYFAYLVSPDAAAMKAEFEAAFAQ